MVFAEPFFQRLQGILKVRAIQMLCLLRVSSEEVNQAPGSIPNVVDQRCRFFAILNHILFSRVRSLNVSWKMITCLPHLQDLSQDTGYRFHVWNLLERLRRILRDLKSIHESWPDTGSIDGWRRLATTGHGGLRQGSNIQLSRHCLVVDTDRFNASRDYHKVRVEY